VLSAEERARAAYHESGHAVVAAALGQGRAIHRVTILLRARGLGSTAIERESDALLLTRTELYGRLVKATGGMAAEELVFGEPSTGAEQDVEHATEIARDIVGRYGMSPVIGRTRVLASDVDAFLGVDSGVSNVSPSTHEEFDRQVKLLIDQADRDATKLLASLRAKLDEMADRLILEETLEGGALNEILDGVEVVTGALKDPFKASTRGAKTVAGSR
jgi:cell division protease FtsH